MKLSHILSSSNFWMYTEDFCFVTSWDWPSLQLVFLSLEIADASVERSDHLSL